MSDWVSIARIVKSRGIHGELAADLLTDFPERFESIRQVRVAGPKGAFQEVLENFWFHRGRVILKFEGLDRPHHAEHLVGGLVQVPEEDRIEPPEDTFFHDQLAGCRVLDSGRLIGTVARVVETAPLEAHLIVATAEGGEVIVPLVRRFVREVNLAAATIITELPPGLIELNQPAGRRAGKAPEKKH